MRTFPWYFWVVMAVLAVLVAVLAATGKLEGGGSSDSDHSRDRYLEDRAFCEDRATEEVNASDGLYRVGGNHWVDAVNHCLLERAGD